MRFKITVILLLSLSALLLYILFAPLPTYHSTSITAKETFTTEEVAEGKRIAQTICIRCHYSYETGTLAGRQHGNPKRLGDFSSGNITQDSATGIGTWSTGQLYYFLRTGIKPNGEYVFDMPKYPNMSQTDVYSIVAFLKSDDKLVRSTYFPKPEPNYSFLTKMLLHFVVRPPAYKEVKVLPPDTTSVIAFGRYLATAKFSCYECHSLNSVTLNYNTPEKSWGFFRGGNPHVNEQRGKIYTSNITGDRQQGIGKWSEAEFIRTVKHGIKPNGETVRDPMFPFYLLSDTEVKAIYRYLKTLP